MSLYLINKAKPIHFYLLMAQAIYISKINYFDINYVKFKIN